MGTPAQEVIPTAVSDIFFNMRHDDYDRLYDDGDRRDVTEEEIVQALRQDATDMVGWMSSLGIEVTETGLVNDFLRRR